MRQLTEAGCEIYPMKCIDTDHNVYLRRDSDFVSVLAKYYSRLVGCGNFETTEGLRTDSPAGGVDPHENRVQFCVHRPTSPFILAISRTDTVKEKKLIESCCFVFQLQVSHKTELQAEKFWPDVFPSMVQEMQGEDCCFD